MEIKNATQAQEEYCERNGVPLFAPYNGFCHNCFKNIYWHYGQDTRVTGYTPEEARSTHITSCPHCNASFVE